MHRNALRFPSSWPAGRDQRGLIALVVASPARAPRWRHPLLMVRRWAPTSARATAALYRVGVVDTPIDDDPTDSVDPVPVSGHIIDAVAMSDPPRVLGRLRCALGLARSACLISGAGCGGDGARTRRE